MEKTCGFNVQKNSLRPEVQLSFTATVQKGCSLPITRLDGFLLALLTTLRTYPATAI